MNCSSAKGDIYVPGTAVRIPKFYVPVRVVFSYPYSSTSMVWVLRRVVPAAAVTTHAKPHAQQQLARDLEVERAAPSALPWGSAVGLKVSVRCSEAIRSHVDWLLF